MVHGHLEAKVLLQEGQDVVIGCVLAQLSQRLTHALDLGDRGCLGAAAGWLALLFGHLDLCCGTKGRLYP